MDLSCWRAWMVAGAALLMACTGTGAGTSSSSSSTSSSSSSTSSSSGGGMSSMADAGAADAAVMDAGSADAAVADAGNPDASTADAGTGLPRGAPCDTDQACGSGTCLDWANGRADKVCTWACTAQDDCADVEGYHCQARTAGSTEGWCVPPSPFHCAECNTAEMDCSGMADACTIGPGDTGGACHVDCSLAGQAACPPDYLCTSSLVDGVTRMLCQPGTTAICRESAGGACDGITGTFGCERTNAAGTCAGTRGCVDGRFTPCDAPLPACRETCDAEAPAGCTVDVCPAATRTAEACGACDRPCPGLGTMQANVACNTGNTCSFTCRGEHYDSDRLPSTGCEEADTPTGGHVQADARDLGMFPCDDELSVVAVGFTSAEVIPSDARVHDPPVLGFNMLTGSAPDWFRVTGTGGTLCFNDVAMTLQLDESLAPECYRLTVITDSTSMNAQTDASGTATLALGTGSYNSGSVIHVVVEKTCLTSVTENVAYTVTGHL